MAVDHYPEETLTRHRFSRAGDRWKYMLPRLRRKPIASEVFRLLNVKRVWQHGSYRVPVPCPHCQALKLTADDSFAIRFWGGGVNDHSGVNDRPQRVGCLACGQGLDATDLLSGWKARDLDALVTGVPLRAYCPTPQTFIVDEYEPGKFWIGRTVLDALHGRVGPVFPLTRRLSRIEAMNPGHAMTLVGQHHASMPWRDVAITREIEPEDPAWHGGPLQAWEKQKLDRRRQQAKREARQALDAEVEAFRAQRAAELRL